MSPVAKKGPGVTYGQVYVVWRTAVAEKPLTADEIAEEIELAASSVRQLLVTCWRRGYLVRRKRVTERKYGMPYEYELRGPEDD